MTDTRDSLRELVARFDEPITLDEVRARRASPAPPRRMGRHPITLAAAACVVLVLGGLVWLGIGEESTVVSVGTQGDPTGPTETSSPDAPAVPAYAGTFGGFCPFLSQASIERSFAHVPEGTPPRFDLLGAAELCLTTTGSLGAVDDLDLVVVRRAEHEATIGFRGPSGETGRIELVRGRDVNAPWVATAITSDQLRVADVATEADSHGQRTHLRLTIASSLAGQAELHVDSVSSVSGVLLEPVARSLVDLDQGTNEVVVALDPAVGTEDLVIRLEATDAAGAPVVTKFRWAD